jgi:hypothetical protein
MSEFNGYGFDDPKMRRRMKYLVIEDSNYSNLYLNEAYAFKNKKELREHLKGDISRRVMAVLEVKDITTQSESEAERGEKI